MNDLAKRLVIAVVLFFLVAFGYIQLQKAAAAEAENRRLTIVNAGLDSIANHWHVLFTAADTVLREQLLTIDSLATRTGPIRWRTVRDTIVVIEPGRTDTLVVTDSVAVIEGDSAVHIIPTVVALELQQCRLLTESCTEFKHTADSTIKWQATHIDTLQAQIDVLDKRFDVPHLSFLGMSLPLPAIEAGYGIMFSLNECGSEETSFDGDILVVTKPQCDKLHHGLMVGLTWTVWSP